MNKPTHSFLYRDKVKVRPGLHRVSEAHHIDGDHVAMLAALLLGADLIAELIRCGMEPRHD